MRQVQLNEVIYLNCNVKTWFIYNLYYAHSYMHPCTCNHCCKLNPGSISKSNWRPFASWNDRSSSSYSPNTCLEARPHSPSSLVLCTTLVGKIMPNGTSSVTLAPSPQGGSPHTVSEPLGFRRPQRRAQLDAHSCRRHHHSLLWASFHPPPLAAYAATTIANTIVVARARTTATWWHTAPS